MVEWRTAPEQYQESWLASVDHDVLDEAWSPEQTQSLKKFVDRPTCCLLLAKEDPSSINGSFLLFVSAERDSLCHSDRYSFPC